MKPKRLGHSISRPPFSNQVDKKNVPKELRDLTQWVVWYCEKEEDRPKWTKPPRNVGTEKNASCSDPGSWADFISAYRWHEENKDLPGTFTYKKKGKLVVATHATYGVGFQLTQNDPFVGIDIDDCFENGRPNQKAQAIIDKFKSYSEISPSGKGIRIITKGKIDRGRNSRKHGLEVYSKSRYLTITGNIIGESREIGQDQDAIDWLIETYFSDQTQVENQSGFTPIFDDDDLLRKIGDSIQGAKFRRLFIDGDISGYESQSEADAALLQILAFWTDKDTDRMERLFSQSKLGQRSKWTGRLDYRERTIAAAISFCTDTYRGSTRNPEKALAAARVDVEKLPDQVTEDPGAPFEPEMLTSLAVLRQHDPAAWARTRETLKKTGVSMRELNSALGPRRGAGSSGARSGDSGWSDGAIYGVHEGRMFHLKATRDGKVKLPLANFDIRIVAEETHDDGAEQTTQFAIEGTLADGEALPRVEVPAAQFPAMNWVTAQWGARAVVSAGMGTKDHLRAAIQSRSGKVPRRMVYTHLGWRKINGKWYFLHADGAVGPIVPNVPITEVVVDPGGNLIEYRLPDPPTGSDLQKAVAASLAVLETAPSKITLPLLAGVYRAPLGEALPVKLSLFVVGPTGHQKTAVTALAQGHFGEGFNGENLPGNWTSTANSLERQAFLAKDVIFTVDDFAPTGTQIDVQRLHKEAERLLRGQANQAGRGRMRADGTLRPINFPRGLIVSSGEDIPRGQSLRARTLIIQVAPGDVNLERLTSAQNAMADGLFAGAMAGYVQWLVPQIDGLKKELPELHRELRDEARQAFSGHNRTPDICASLALGWELFLRFAEDVGALTKEEAEARWKDGWKTLREVGVEQDEHQGGEDPTRRFLELLRAAIASGRAHLADAKNGDEPPSHQLWGWRDRTVGTGDYMRIEAEPKGERIGWIDDDNVLLEPDAVFAVVQRLGREQGNGLMITQQTLWKRMSEKGWLASREKGRNHQRWQIMGNRHRIIHISQDTLWMGNRDKRDGRDNQEAIP